MNSQKKFNQNHKPIDPPDIITCARYGMIDALRTALHQKPQLINEHDGKGLTALHWAAGNRDFLTVSLLLSSDGIDVDQKDTKNRTAFDHALSSGDEKTIQAFIQYVEKQAE